MTQTSTLAKSNRLSTVFFYNLKRLRSILIFYSAALFLFSPVAMLVEWGIRATEQGENNYNPMEVFLFSYPSEIVFHLTIMVMAIGMPLFLFHYMNQKRALDVFHALPVSRSNLYWGNYLSGLAVMAVPYLIFGSMGAGMMRYGHDVAGDGAFYRLMLLVLVAVCLYSTMTFVIVNCGTLFESIVYFVVVHIGYFAAVWVGYYYLNERIFGYQEFTMSGGLATIAALSPIFQTVYFVFEGGNSRILFLPIVSIVAAVLGGVLYQKRKSESAGQSFAYLPIFYIGSLMLSISAGVGAATLFDMLMYSNNSVVGALFGIVLGNVCYWILDSIRRRGVRQFLKSLTVSLSATAVVTLLLLAVNLTGLFGYEDYLPNEDQVKSVTVEWDDNRGDMLGYVLDRSFPLSDQENIERVISFHKGVLQNKKVFEAYLHSDPLSTEEEVAESYILTGEHESYVFEDLYDVLDYTYGDTRVKLSYKLKNGLLVERYYHTSMLLTKPLYDIAESDAYRKSYLTVLEQQMLDAKTEKQISFSSVSRFRQHTPYDRMRYASSNEFAPELLEAIKTDLANRPAGYHLRSENNPIGKITIDFGRNAAVQMSSNLPITPEDKNILAVLERIRSADAEMRKGYPAVTNESPYAEKARGEKENALSVSLHLLSDWDTTSIPFGMNMMAHYGSGFYCYGVESQDIPYQKVNEIYSLCYTHWFGETAMDMVLIDGNSYVIPPENLEKVKAILSR